MANTKDIGRKSGTVVTAANSAQLGFQLLESHDKAALAILATSTQAVTLTVKLGTAADTAGSLPHTITQAVAANTTLLTVIPMVPGVSQGEIYLANASGSTATYTLDAGLRAMS